MEKSLFLLFQDVPKLQEAGMAILEKVLSGASPIPTLFPQIYSIIHSERGLAKWLFALAEQGFPYGLPLFLITATGFGPDSIKC